MLFIYLLSYHGPTLPRTQHSDVVFNYSDSGVGLFYVDTVDLYQEENIDAILLDFTSALLSCYHTVSCQA